MNKQVILAVVLFYVVSNPATYKLVDSFLGRFFRVARNGSPTFAGLLVHAAVFGALLMFLLPKISGLREKTKNLVNYNNDIELITSIMQDVDSLNLPAIKRDELINKLKAFKSRTEPKWIYLNKMYDTYKKKVSKGEKGAEVILKNIEKHRSKFRRSIENKYQLIIDTYKPDLGITF